MTKAERFEGCILAGAVGDAFGSGYENINKAEPKDTFYLFGKPEKKTPEWSITDDTQLTLATIEAMMETENIVPENIANHFLRLFKQKRLKGIGASTLKALRELDVGGHWRFVGRKGEFAAGNGAAMRIAPIAFKENVSNQDLRDVCFITHQNDEAYIGAKCVVIAIKEILLGNWTGDKNLIELIINQTPDTRIRDRLIEIKQLEKLSEIGLLGNDGYVVNSVPLAIAAANQVTEIGLENMFSKLIEIGGDTDTNCSIAGQIAGTLIGRKGIPNHLLDQLINLTEYNWIQATINKFNATENNN